MAYTNKSDPKTLQKLREQVAKKRLDTVTQNRAESTTEKNESRTNKSDPTVLEKLRAQVAKDNPEYSTPRYTGGATFESMASLIGSSKKSTSLSDSKTKNNPFKEATASSLAKFTNQRNGMTAIGSKMTEEQRNARIKEIDNELFTLKKARSGLGRASLYGNPTDLIEQNEARQAELKAEREQLTRVGLFSGKDTLQWEISDAEKEVAKWDAVIAKYGSRPSKKVADEWRAAQSERYKAQEKVDNLKRIDALYEDIDKYSNAVNKDTFGGQFAANYRSNSLSRAADEAFARYLDNPTEENKEVAYAYDALSRLYSTNNEVALDENGQVLPWISKSVAGYLPQFKDQIIPEAIGGGVGGLVGSTVGLPTAGAALGAGLATSSQTYPIVRGSVYRTLLAEGVDEETARMAANDEAVIGAIIEGGESALSVLLAGGMKALSAIGAAASKSVAKGSTNIGTKFIANMFGKSVDKAAGKAAVEATRPLWNTALRTGAGILGNAASEYGEEFLQEGVSIANKDRALRGESGTGNLVAESAGQVWDAVSGKDPGALSQMHAAGMEGAKIGLLFGGANTIVNSTVAHYANAKTVKQQEKIIDGIIEDKEVLTALVDEGKASGEGTVSEKIATEIEDAMKDGKVTRDQVKQLIASNEVYIKHEETQNEGEKASVDAAPITLEEAAAGAVERRNIIQPVTVEEAKKGTSFGDYGAKLVADLANKNGSTVEQVKSAVEVAYMAGFTGLDSSKANFVTDTQINAFTAGKQDRLMQDTTNRETAKKAVVYDTGFIENEHSKKLTDAQREVMSVIAKDLKLESGVVSRIVASVVNGVEYEANAYHQDGKLRISSTTENPIAGTTVHEGFHRVKQLAPDEFKELANFIYNTITAEERSEKYNSVKADHDAAGIEMDADSIIEEIAVRSIESKLDSPEKFLEFRNSLEANPQIKSTWQKVWEAIVKVLEDIKAAITNSKLALETKRKALAEADRLDALMRDAYKAAMTAADNRVAEVENSQNDGGNKTAEGYNGSISYSLKDGENNNRDIDIKEEALAYVPMTRVKMKKFPPYNESKSDAHEWATRWAHRDDVEAGAQSLAFYHGQCYVIGKYDSADLKYQIEGRIRYSAYEAIRKELEEDARNREKQPEKKTADIISERNRGRNSNEGRGQGTDNSSNEYGGKDREVFRLDRNQDSERETQKNIGRSDEYDSENRQAGNTLTEEESKAVKALGDGAKVVTDKNGDMLIATNKDKNTVMYSIKTHKNGGRAALEKALRANGHTEAEIRETLSYVDDAADYLTILAAGFARNQGYNALSDHLVADIITNVKTGKQVLSAVVNNGDYPVNIDLALICKKRVAYMHLMNRLIDDGIFDKVNYGGDAIAKVNTLLREDGFETACLGCFVESRRLQFQAWAETIVSEWNSEVDKRKKNAGSFNFAEGNAKLTAEEMDMLAEELKNAGKKNDQGNLNLGQGSVQTRMGRLLDKLPSLQKHLTVADLLKPEGLTALRAYDSNLFSIVKSRYGAASPKIVQDYNPYASEIAMMTFSLVKNITNNGVKGADSYRQKVINEMGGRPVKQKGETKEAFKARREEFNAKVEDGAIRKYLYDIGGARIQSFSDFMIENVFDYIQIFADLSAKRLPLHGYTKEIVALRLFGMTGAKWNGSWIAHVDRDMGKEYAGLLPASEAKNGNAILVHTKDGDFAIGFDDYARHKATNGESFVQSIGMKDMIALQLDSRYSANVGSITIGVSDKQILAMLDSPLFRYVIPYHSSGMLPQFAKLVGVDLYNDYEDYQNTTVKQWFDAYGNPCEPIRNAKKEIIDVDTSYAFNAEVQKTGDAKKAADNYLKWCGEKHPIHDSEGKLIGYATFNPKFSNSPYGTDFTKHENYYKMLEDFNSYDNITGESAVQGAVTMTFPSKENRLSASEMEAYKARLRETGIFSEKEIEKYAAIANKTLKQLIAAEVKGRADYQNAQAPKWDKTVGKVEDMLLTEHKREPKSFSLKKLDAEYLELAKDPEKNEAKLREMVAEAAENALKNGAVFTLADDTSTMSYKLHRDKPPKKTRIVYKTFNVDENGLPHATYAGVNDGMPIGIWLDAVAQPFVVGADGNKYIPGTTGTAPKLAGLKSPSYYGFEGYSSWLSYRPAFHASSVPAPLQMRVKNPETGKKDALPHNKLIFRVEVSADIDYQEEAKERGKTETENRRKYWEKNEEYRNAKREYDLSEAKKRAEEKGIEFDEKTWLEDYDKKGDKVIGAARDQLDYVPKMGLYTYKNQGEEWVLAGSFRILGAVSEDEIRRVNNEHGYPNEGKTALNWIGGYTPEEFVGESGVLKDGEVPPLGDSRYKAIKVAGVTYDDDGDVIPLSERFNSQKIDIRYSLKSGLSGSEINAARLSKYKDTMSTEEYGKLVERYGAIPKGEKPSRNIQVPKQTDDDKKVSQTVRTILEAKATPEEAVPTIEKMVEDGVFSYDVYTDKQAISDAESYIEGYGWDESLDDWFKDLEKGVVSKQHTAMGWALYNNAANIAATTTSETEKTTAIKTSLKILDAMVKHQRNAAQAVQATRILKKLSPETQLYGIQKSVSALKKELTDKYGKKAPDLKIDESLAEQFLKAETDEERAAAEKEIYKDIGRQMPSRFADKWNAWRYLAMLGNVRTHARNIVGNAGFAPVVAVKNIAATGIEAAVYGISGKKTVRGKSLIVGSKKDRALLTAAWNDYGNVADLVSNGGKYSDFAVSNQYIEEGRVIFKGVFKPLEVARKGNSKALEAEDVWFSRPHYAFALAMYCKANNITPEQIARGKAIEPARAYAIKEAQKATYKDTNAFSQMVSGWGRSNKDDNIVVKAGNTVIEGILPFRKTPANILVRGVEYSPIGLLKGLTYDLVQVSKGKMTAAEAIDNISAGLTGTGLVALGVFMAAQGLIRGHGEDDEDERKFKEMMGHQSYALELPNGTSITLDWLAPEALPFFVGVNLWEMAQEKKDKVNFSSILKAISTVSEPMLEMSCLQSLNDVFESVGYAASNDTSGLVSVLSSAATSYLTQGLPTLFGQAERTSEKYRMTTYTDKNAFPTGDMQYTFGKASAKIPGLDFNQIPYIDAWGRKEASGTALKRGFNNFLNPAYTSKIENGDVEKELLRLYEETGEGSVFPSRAAKYFTVDGKRKDLTADEYVRYATLKGEKSYKAVTDLIKSKAYQQLDDADKVKAIENAYDLANQKAKQAVSKYAPQKWVDYADEFGTDSSNYLSFKTEVSSTKQANGDKISKSEVAEIIGDTAKNDDEAWLMYLSMYDGKGDYEAMDSGVKAMDYMAYQTGLEEAKSDGSLTKAEAVDVLAKLNLDDEDAWAMYLSDYDSPTAQEAKKHGIDATLYMTAAVDMSGIKADYDKNGKAISGSRRKKIERYLNSVCGSYKEYLFLLGTEYSSVKDDHDYIAYFGK